MCSYVCVSVFLIQGGPKNGLFLTSDNFATANLRKACNTSNISEFRLE